MYVPALVQTDGTMLRRALLPDEPGADWTLTDHLLALAVDRLSVLIWQKTKDGRKGRNRPKPISPLARNKATRHGGPTGRTPEEVKAYLAQFGPPPS